MSSVPRSSRPGGSHSFLGMRMDGDQTVLRIGTWRVDPATDVISRGAETHKLEPRTMRLLLYLAARPGQVVDLDRLLNEVWSGVVVTSGSVYQAIAQLRHLLGDQAEQPTYIETHARKGYRLVASVSPWVDPDSDSQSFNGVPSAPPHGGHVAKAVSGRSRHRLLAAALLFALVGAAALVWFVRTAPRHTPVQPGSTTLAPPPHSIAVLPFVNLSGDKEQEYFSDGLTEELLNSLAQIDGLQVAARTSSFSFREHPDVADVAHKLNVATVLEGSVRRSGHTIRISAQLINAVTGFHLWSKTYDRDLGDLLKLQTEIATAVASALEVTLLGDVAAKIELGGTRNPAAFDAYLRGSQVALKDAEAAIAGYTEAIRLDPNYALAFAYRSIMVESCRVYLWSVCIRRYHWTKDDERALADARQAVTLAPELAEGHVALATVAVRALDFANANAELERAIALAPGNALVLGSYGRLAAMTGRTDVGIAAAHRAVILDPLNPLSHYRHGTVLYFARRYSEAVAAFNRVLALDPQAPDSPGIRGLAYYGLGDFERARSSCEGDRPDDDSGQECLAITYQRLARRADAKKALAELRAAADDRWAYDCAAIYAQWGNTSQALQSLESAWRLRVPELRWLKADPLLDPLRKEPRFQAIERALKFP